MLQKELNHQQVMQLGEQILAHMEGSIIERGYDYFARGLVFNIQVKEGESIASAVQGSQIYQVEIDLHTFPDSTCSCPYPTYCKHIAAAFFQVYSVFANPKQFLHQLQQPRTEAFSAALLYPQVKTPRKKHADYLPLPQSPLTEESPIQEWWRFFYNWTRNLSTDMEKHRLFAELRSNYERVLTIARTWDRVRAQLFTIHAILHHLQKLEEYGQWMKISPLSPGSQELMRSEERFREELEAMLFYLDAAKLSRTELAATLRTCEALTDKGTVINWPLITQMIWWYLVCDPQEMQSLASNLKQRLSDKKLSPSEIRKAELLQTHFAILDGEDERALGIWDRLQTYALPTFLFYVKVIARREEWQRLLGWFERLSDLIQKAQGQDYRLVTAIWRHALKEAGQLCLWGMQLKKMLPKSFHEYSAYLFEQNRYQEWLDLQMAMGTPYPEVTAQAKSIEEAEPMLLLPLYIREINRLISQRNRSGYKEAVKLIKKVRSCYLQADQLMRWDLYIKQLAGKHKRLRTFQEELRRGNLIS